VKHTGGLPEDAGSQQSQAIESLLARHGGEGEVILSDAKVQFDQVARHVWWWEQFPG